MLLPTVQVWLKLKLITLHKIGSHKSEFGNRKNVPMITH